MNKLLSTTALAAMLALGGGSWAQSTGGSTGGAGQAGSQGGAQGGATGQSGSGGASAQSGGQSGGQSGAQSSGPSGGQAQSGTGAGQSGRGGEGMTRPGAAGQPAVGAQTTGVMTQEQVMAKLSSEGFSNVQSVTRDGNSYRTRATQNGRPVDVTVDAYTGTIRSQAAAR